MAQNFLNRKYDKTSAPTPVPQTPDFTPTEEQQAIIDAATSSDDNLLVSALAGAAKTSTLVIVANQPALANTSILCLAFNKKIADEMKARLPANCTSMTLNSLGHRAWGKYLGRRLNLYRKKNFDILKELVENERSDIKDELYGNFATLLRAIQHAKSQGWVPSAYLDVASTPPTTLLSDDEFFLSLDEEPDPIEFEIITKAVCTSIVQALDGIIDFDDQIYMTALWPAPLASYPFTFIDEAQDLSPLNHHTLSKIVGDNRIMAVGDPCQAIYAFRGANSISMELLKDRFNMRTLELSVSFRCPSEIVAEAQWRAPHMRAFKEGGTVVHFDEWSIDDLADDAVILCRNNAPIFSMAIRLLANGRRCQIVGNDIGKYLTRAMTKLGDKSMSRDEARTALVNYKRIQLSKARDHAKGRVHDTCRCIEVFLNHGDTLGEAISYAEYLMTMTGSIHLMTGHKSKGLEFPNVYILDRELLRIDKAEEGVGQDHNLLYVMQTRALENLSYITGKAFVGDNIGEEED